MEELKPYFGNGIVHGGTCAADPFVAYFITDQNPSDRVWKLDVELREGGQRMLSVRGPSNMPGKRVRTSICMKTKKTYIPSPLGRRVG
jgi:hypothetical protein